MVKKNKRVAGTAIKLYLEEELARRLKAQARDEGLSLDDLIVDLLKKAVPAEKEAPSLSKEEVDKLLRKHAELEQALKKLAEMDKLA